MRSVYVIWHNINLKSSVIIALIQRRDKYLFVSNNTELSAEGVHGRYEWLTGPHCLRHTNLSLLSQLNDFTIVVLSNALTDIYCTKDILKWKGQFLKF